MPAADTCITWRSTPAAAEWSRPPTPAAGSRRLRCPLRLTRVSTPAPAASSADPPAFSEPVCTALVRGPACEYQPAAGMKHPLSAREDVIRDGTAGWPGRGHTPRSRRRVQESGSALSMYPALQSPRRTLAPSEPLAGRQLALWPPGMQSRQRGSAVRITATAVAARSVVEWPRPDEAAGAPPRAYLGAGHGKRP